MISVSKALINLKYLKEWFRTNDVYDQHDCEAIDVAIKALEAQKRLLEYKDCSICEWFEDYDWDENDVSEYYSVASVYDFLIDELKEETDED